LRGFFIWNFGGIGMGIVDAHCDVICKMLTDEDADFAQGRKVDASLPRLSDGGVALQFFAIYVPDELRPHAFAHILRSAAIFSERILSRPEMVPVRRKADLARVIPGRQIGALLTLEGVDAVPADEPWAIRILHELGIRSVGITWNHANWAADGAGEPRGGGLTRAGRRLVAELNRLGMLVDVSHLSERGFWDVAGFTERPFIASHSNVQSLCSHPRNLNNAQIDHIIATRGMIGLTFVPYFLVPEGRQAAAADLLRHLDAICARGGAGCVGFGSDFDGFDTPLPGLEHPGKYGTLRELLLKRYTAADTEAFLGGNWLNFLARELPD
jgi:membrane dipeptidase